MVLKVQAITYPRTSCVRSSNPVLGPYFGIHPDKTTLVPCSRMAAKLDRCFVVRNDVFMAFEMWLFDIE